MKKDIIITRIITITFLVSLTLCLCIYFIHLNQDCTHNDNCQICVIIQKFNDNLIGFNQNQARLIITFLFILSPIIIYLIDKLRDKNQNTLVRLKVELLS